MLKTIIEKEVRELISSSRFAIAMSVCAVLIILSFVSGAQEYHAAQRQYEAAKAENLRQVSGVTDWLMVRHNRIFLPPDPVAAVVTGVSNDIGRTVEVSGRGELSAEDTRFEGEPLFAVFRFLDLEFVFGFVLSLLAILLGYDAVCGEKERGTLRLVFSNAVPRATFVFGKLLGALAGLIPVLVIPLLLGCLVLVVMRIPMAAVDWVRLAFVIATGLLFVVVVVAVAVMVSAVTHRSSHAFLALLVIWVFAVFVVPRTAVLLAGRAVDVPSVDKLAAEKAAYSRQLWQQSREQLASFTPTKTDDVGQMMKEFQQTMEKQSDERDKNMQELSGRLNESRANGQRIQAGWAFALARLSPLASFTLAATALAATDLKMKDRFEDEAYAYQTDYARFMKAKTGMVPGAGMIIMKMKHGGEEEPKPVDPRELPEMQHRKPPLAGAVTAALPNVGLLMIWGLGAFAGAFIAFLRYDLR